MRIRVDSCDLWALHLGHTYSNVVWPTNYTNEHEAHSGVADDTEVVPPTHHSLLTILHSARRRAENGYGA